MTILTLQFDDVTVKTFYREKTVYIKTHKKAINRPVDETGET